ncbi:hypothetical protein Tco_1185782 [Tanacetum coccineum]
MLFWNKPSGIFFDFCITLKPCSDGIPDLFCSSIHEIFYMFYRIGHHKIFLAFFPFQQLESLAAVPSTMITLITGGKVTRTTHPFQLKFSLDYHSELPSYFIVNCTQGVPFQETPRAVVMNMYPSSVTLLRTPGSNSNEYVPLAVVVAAEEGGDEVEMVVMTMVDVAMEIEEVTSAGDDVDGGCVVVVLVAAVVVGSGRSTRMYRDLSLRTSDLLDKVVQAGMYRDLSLRTSGPLQDSTTATITTITITNGDGMRRVRIFRETISPE